MLLVAYDCEGMQAGERMVVRLKEYETEQSGSGKETLRGSAVVHICSPPHVSSSSAAPTKDGDEPAVATPPPLPPSQKYYLHSTLRLIFSPLSKPPSSSSSQPIITTRHLIDLGSPLLGPARFLPFDPASDSTYTAYLALRKARRKEVRGTPSPDGKGEERGRRGSGQREGRGGGGARERGEGGGEGVVLSFGKRREVVGRRKGGGERGEETVGEKGESELSRRMKGMMMVGR